MVTIQSLGVGVKTPNVLGLWQLVSGTESFESLDTNGAGFTVFAVADFPVDEHPSPQTPVSLIQRFRITDAARPVTSKRSVDGKYVPIMNGDRLETAFERARRVARQPQNFIDMLDNSCSEQHPRGRSVVLHSLQHHARHVAPTELCKASGRDKCAVAEVRGRSALSTSLVNTTRTCGHNLRSLVKQIVLTRHGRHLHCGARVMQLGQFPFHAPLSRYLLVHLIENSGEMSQRIHQVGQIQRNCLSA